MADLISGQNLSVQNGHNLSGDRGTKRVLVLGEVLWDVFEESTRLGGAPLNFSAHLKRLGYDPLLISGVGADELGDRTTERMAALGLETRFIQKILSAATGTARVQLGPGNSTSFRINRPAAYDSITLSDGGLKPIQDWSPSWFYFGTLFSHFPQGKALLDRLLSALPSCSRFYDLNLRPDCQSPSLVQELLAVADVVKLNQDELEAVQGSTNLPMGREAFCREGAKRFGWRAVCITLGAGGCAVLRGSDYVEAQGYAVDVADTVGAGDAFAAAFLHGLISNWPVAKIAFFANRVGALVASRPGAIPDWTLAEAIDS
jgi:fructokinase